MENMNVVDLAAIAIILVSTILAYFRGLSREILAIVSWVIAALMGFIIAPYLDPFINKIPIIKEILMDSCELSIMISYIVGFLLSLIFLSLLIPILTNIIHQSNLNGLDKLLGLCFGASRGLLIIIVLTIVYDLFFIDNKSLPQVESSQTNKLSAEIKNEVKALIPNSKPKWMIERFNLLMTVCEKTNTKILKLM
jgi:membrane protein required for colicin V production